MTKRKRTLKEVIAMQEKAVRFQDNLFNFDAARRIEALEPEQYAMLRSIEIVDKPIQKRKRSKQKKNNDVPPGYERHIEVTESHELIPGGTRRQRITKTWLVPKSNKSVATKGSKKR